MNIPPRDFTSQEQVIGKVLSDLGLRYEEQYAVGYYTVDFYIPEISLAIEADGLYGHFRKRDLIRDTYLMHQDDVNNVLHITEVSYTKIKDEIWRALMNL